MSRKAQRPAFEAASRFKAPEGGWSRASPDFAIDDALEKEAPLDDKLPAGLRYHVTEPGRNLCYTCVAPCTFWKLPVSPRLRRERRSQNDALQVEFLSCVYVCMYVLLRACAHGSPTTLHGLPREAGSWPSGTAMTSPRTHTRD